MTRPGATALVWLAVLAWVLPVPPLSAGVLSVDSGLPVFLFPLGGVSDAGASGVASATGSGTAAAAKSGAASQAATAAIVDGLQAATVFCGSLSQVEYRVDCLSERLASVAAAMPASGDYAEARAAIETAALKLAALAARNADPVLPRGRARSGGAGGVTTSRPLTPVATASLPAVNAEATAIVEEAATVLLRSSDASAARQLAYRQISVAVGSAKVLLRSA